VESNENPLAKNPADPSYGLMQLLYPRNLTLTIGPLKMYVDKVKGKLAVIKGSG
jgi:hypothetical protein